MAWAQDPSTLQIGEAAVIAERTGMPVVSDFRPRDIAAGGQGAPLVPFVDYLLFKHHELSRIALNIGGIANITVIPANAKPEEVIAFDTGPGNMVMDALAPPFDRDGERARGGRVDEKLLEQLLADPYYRRDPPKSCGREQYGVTERLDQTARTFVVQLTPTRDGAAPRSGGGKPRWVGAAFSVSGNEPPAPPNPGRRPKAGG